MLPLFNKELKDIFFGKPFLLALLLVILLSGHSYIQAILLYSQASVAALEHAELAKGITPLDGIFVPVFGALYLISTFALPFIAIRSISAEKESGSIKILLQLPYSLDGIVWSKFFAVLCAWLMLSVPPFLSIALWLGDGGHVGLFEMSNLLLGHMLYAVLIIAIAFLAAAFSGNSASAAIVTLGMTLVFWALDYSAGNSDGLLRDLSVYSPTAILRGFERGGFLASSVWFAVGATVVLISTTASWLHTGFSLQTRVYRTVPILSVVLVLVWLGSLSSFYVDVTEDRRNSFAKSIENGLKKFKEPLVVTVNLSVDDPRYYDLKRSILDKLSFVLDDMVVVIAANAKGDDYGIVKYRYGMIEQTSRSTSQEEVLPMLFEMTGVSLGSGSEDDNYSGYPLVVKGKKAEFVFYILLPLLVVALYGRRVYKKRVFKNALKEQR